MPTLSELTNRLVLWLKANPTDPPIREYALTANLPHAAYPALALLPERVRYAPNRQCAEARYRLRLSACAGRPADALAQAQELAAQLKAQLEASQQLGGLARQLAVESLQFSAKKFAETANRLPLQASFIQQVELGLVLRFTL